jgi:hypothetical protein
MVRGQALLFCALLALPPCSGAAQVEDQDKGKEDPVNKIIRLLTDMKDQVEKEASADMVGYNKYMCWCDTNRKEKTEAVEIATKKIAELTTFLEEGAAKKEKLKTEIEGLAADIAEDTEALATATALRQDENSKFKGAEADMKETRQLLTEAVEVLSKVQLLQTDASGAEAKKAKLALVQVHNIVSRRFPKYESIMQRDFYDVMGSFEEMTQSNKLLTGAFMSGADRAKAASLAQSERRGRLLPWEKTEEQIGQEKKPNELIGAAAGAKSYNSRSGRILGVLSEMKDEFTRDLAKATYDEYLALVSFLKLKSAKTSEIFIATETKKRKETALAELLDAIAQAKADKAAMEDAKAADEAFLVELEKSCKDEDAAYHERLAARTEEIRALSEALKILTEDDARATFGRSFSLLQQRSQRKSSTEAELAQDRRSEKAMQRIAAIAKKHKNWALVSLAVRTRLDSFKEVIAAMDTMAAELATQQKKEYEKWESCKFEIDKTEDTIKVEERTKKELGEKHTSLVDKIDTLNGEIAELRKEVADNEVALKDAGEDRKVDNQLYQASVMDQRATVRILEKALARLKTYYAALLQTQQPVPGAAAPPPPARGKAYEKGAGAAGVLQVIQMVIEDATRTEQALDKEENEAQKSYAAIVNDLTASIEADRTAIEEKQQQVAATEVEKSETEEAQLANDEELKNLAELLHAHHLECDFLLKYFDIRQKARQEEMDAISDAKAILSGADFGR